MLRFGGFPEPLFHQDEREHRIWQRDRVTRVVRDDLRDLEQVREISLVEQLVDLLPDRVGSPLSVKSLREDLEVDHKTVERWLTILENLYLCFRIAPFGPAKVRAVKKERKLYLWDWSTTPEGGPRFENLVASQLLKYCHFVEDTEGHAMELRFLRDTDKRESRLRGSPEPQSRCSPSSARAATAASAPRSGTSQSVRPIPRFFQVHLGDRHFETGATTVLPFRTFCRELNLP